jgi:MerR family transcriptional regulator, thiopeptide resistance regulator
MAQRYRVGEIAEMTGVSIRALHHYDQLGLLTPSERTEGGQRLYVAEDLGRLQQILTLRCLGFSLKQIGELLSRPEFDLVVSLRVQRQALRDRIAELERILAALGELLDRRVTDGVLDWSLAAQAAAAARAGLIEKGETMDRYYTPEQMKQFQELRDEVGEAEIERIQDAWTALLAEVSAAAGSLDPASEEASLLADRWAALQAETMAHYQSRPELTRAIQANYERGAFEGQPRAPQAADFAFIERVNAARAAGSRQ